MADISFIPKDDREEKRSKKGRSHDDWGVEYTSGERLDADVNGKKFSFHKAKKQKKEKSQELSQHKKQLPVKPEKPRKERRKGFWAWRKAKKGDDTYTEQATQEEPVTQEQQSPIVEHRRKESPIPDLFHEAPVRLEDEDSLDFIHTSPPPEPAVPQSQVDEPLTEQENLRSPDLLVDYHAPELDLGEHEAPKHKPEQVQPELITAAVQTYDIGKHPGRKGKEDEAPDMTAARSGKRLSKKEKKKKQEKKEKKSWRERVSKQPTMPRVLTVNLIPDEALAEFQSRNHLRDLLYRGIAVLAIVLIVYGAMNIYQRKIVSDTLDAEADIVEIDRGIAAYSELRQDASRVNDRLEGIEEVLAAHIYWTSFLELLEQLTLPTVYYTSMAGNATTGNFTLDVVALNYQQVEPQVSIFENSPYVESVTASSATTQTSSATRSTTSTQTTQSRTSAGTTGSTTGLGEPLESNVTFTMTVQFDSSLFHRSLQ